LNDLSEASTCATRSFRDFKVTYNGTVSTTTTVRNGLATVGLKPYSTTGTKTIRGYFLGNDLAEPSQGSFTIKVVSR